MKAGNWKKEIAEAIAKEAYVGFVPTGGYYAVDKDNDGVCDDVYWEDKQALWHSWGEKADYVSVMAFADDFNDYSQEDGDIDDDELIPFIMDTMLEESQEL